MSNFFSSSKNIKTTPYVDLYENEREENISSKELQRRHKLVGLVFQNFNLFPHFNVLKNVTLAVNIENKKKIKEFKKTYKGKDKKLKLMEYEKELFDACKTEAINILSNLGLENKINNYPYQLSGGEQQRVAISRALILKPKLLCFDEPTSALDPGLTGEVVNVIKKLKEQNITMLIVTHELDFALSVADKIIVMEKGKIIEEKDNVTC